MPHIPDNDLHWHAGSQFITDVTVENLTAAQTAVASFHCGPVVKTLGDGITVADVNGTAVLTVTLTPDDLDEIGVLNQTRWWARAGQAPAPVVSTGLLTVKAAPTVA